MSGVAIILDLWRKNPNFARAATDSIHSHHLFSATLAVSAAAASLASAKSHLPSRFLFGDGGISVAYSDAGADVTEDFISKLQNISGNIFRSDSINYAPKEYPIALKPLLSAYAPRALALTAVRSFLMFYLPLLEPRAEDDDEFLEEAPGEQPQEHPPSDALWKKSVKQIIFETTVVTTRRILERVAVHYVSQRMAWKLLKDIPKSARRKAARGMTSSFYFYSVSRTTFRAHLLAVAASWLVKVGIEIYQCFSRLSYNEEEGDRVEKEEEFRLLGRRLVIITLKCGASLIFAPIGAAIGSTYFHPSIGQWIGCAIGDLAGPTLVTFLLDRGFHLEL
ncbi:hypothetical protein IFM89_017374 [Coptis chinensis]|uniref:Uncharacterized protein n=1 Tax=Coptis chinensis TaxID=261450 RepID=A0A835HMP4_9MAGN|nr:hypothetical protein IFM89_017374 [Coptis chinensis]